MRSGQSVAKNECERRNNMAIEIKAWADDVPIGPVKVSSHRGVLIYRDLKSLPSGIVILKDGSTKECKTTYERYYMTKGGYPYGTRQEVCEYIDEIWGKVKGDPSLEDKFSEVMNE